MRNKERVGWMRAEDVGAVMAEAGFGNEEIERVVSLMDDERRLCGGVKVVEEEGVLAYISRCGELIGFEGVKGGKDEHS